jgi:hypothetical protein
MAASGLKLDFHIVHISLATAAALGLQQPSSEGAAHTKQLPVFDECVCALKEVAGAPLASEPVCSEVFYAGSRDKVD